MKLDTKIVTSDMTSCINADLLHTSRSSVRSKHINAHASQQKQVFLFKYIHSSV